MTTTSDQTETATDRKRVTRRHLLRLLAIVTTLLVGPVATPENTTPNAYIMSRIGSEFSLNGVGAPIDTNRDAYMSESETCVIYVKTSPELSASIGNMCRWSVTATFPDSSGRW